ncbi:MAG: hypothetical protein WC569_00045 [Candidatus Omnitrophota bacterium]
MVGIRTMSAVFLIILTAVPSLYALRPYEGDGEWVAEESSADIEKINVSNEVNSAREENKRKLRPFVSAAGDEDDGFSGEAPVPPAGKEVTPDRASPVTAASPMRRETHILFSAVILLGFLCSYFFIKPRQVKKKIKKPRLP